MTESLAQQLPPLKRADRFLFNFGYIILGDEDLLALTDSTLEVIGELDEQSYADFYRFCNENRLNVADTFTGNIRWPRGDGKYDVEFDVDPSRLYVLRSYRMAKHSDRVDHYTEKALP